jgi:glutathione S-transferase
MFAALNSVEPHVHNYASLDVFHANEEWARLRKPGAREVLCGRLAAVSASLQGRDYLEHEFSAGDLLMISVLRILRDTDLVRNNPVLASYQARGEARPAFQRALAAQLAPFQRYAPAA